MSYGGIASGLLEIEPIASDDTTFERRCIHALLLIPSAMTRIPFGTTLNS